MHHWMMRMGQTLAKIFKIKKLFLAGETSASQAMINADLNTNVYPYPFIHVG